MIPGCTEWSAVSSLSLQLLDLSWKDAGIGSPCWEGKQYVALPKIHFQPFSLAWEDSLQQALLRLLVNT